MFFIFPIFFSKLKHDFLLSVLPLNNHKKYPSDVEVSNIQGKDQTGSTAKVKVTPEGTLGANPAFDVTPNKLITAIVTDKGILNQPFEQNIEHLFNNIF